MGSFIRPLFKTMSILCVTIIFGLTNLACNDASKDIELNKEPVITTYYLIRHAEKDRTNPQNPDPELQQKGLDRAIRWAEVFDQVALDRIYSTNYERTTMTAAPTSVKKDLDIEFYDPSNLDIEAFKNEHWGQQVLIVGHSNTTPEFANKLLNEETYAIMDDTDNASLFIIRFLDEEPTSMVLKMD